MTDETKTGLPRILSSEVLPPMPEGTNPAMEKYIRDLHNYLRRLTGKFTATNIAVTIQEGGSTVKIITPSELCQVMTQLPGYDSSKHQYLKHEPDGACRWIDAAQC